MLVVLRVKNPPYQWRIFFWYMYLTPGRKLIPAAEVCDATTVAVRIAAGLQKPKQPLPICFF